MYVNVRVKQTITFCLYACKQRWYTVQVDCYTTLTWSWLWSGWMRQWWTNHLLISCPSVFRWSTCGGCGGWFAWVGWRWSLLLIVVAGKSCARASSRSSRDWRRGKKWVWDSSEMHIQDTNIFVQSVDNVDCVCSLTMWEWSSCSFWSGSCWCARDGASGSTSLTWRSTYNNTYFEKNHT